MMNLSALEAFFAQKIPGKVQVAVPLLYMAALYWLSSLPGTPLPDDPALYGLFRWMPPSIQNALHVPAYAALALAWRWALSGWLNQARAQWIGAFGITSIYGVFDEWHQSFVPGRYASLSDITLDIAGAVIGICIAARIGSRARTSKPQMNDDRTDRRA
jgi:hypothetical protein